MDGKSRGVNPELKAYVEGKILPQYERVDAAHGPEHIRAVIRYSLELAEEYGADPDMAYAVAAYHDIGLLEGRENHGVTSGAALFRDKTLRRWFSEEQLCLMREAAEDHRASAGREPRSLYGKIVSEADRNIDPEDIVRRSMAYGRNKFPELDLEGQIARTTEHLSEKYGESGYVRLWLHSPRNERGLQTLRDWLRRPGLLPEICKRYAAEKPQ